MLYCDHDFSESRKGFCFVYMWRDPDSRFRWGYVYITRKNYLLWSPRRTSEVPSISVSQISVISSSTGAHVWSIIIHYFTARSHPLIRKELHPSTYSDVLSKSSKMVWCKLSDGEVSKAEMRKTNGEMTKTQFPFQFRRKCVVP